MTLLSFVQNLAVPHRPASPALGYLFDVQKEEAILLHSTIQFPEQSYWDSMGCCCPVVTSSHITSVLKHGQSWQRRGLGLNPGSSLGVLGQAMAPAGPGLATSDSTLNSLPQRSQS